jgi:hypothetical protein
MVTKPVDLGDGLRFARKGDAEAHFRAILNSYFPGDVVSKEHEKDLMRLIKHHADYVEKVGVGVKEIFVDDAPAEKPGHTKCFYIRRTDNSKIDFSLRECFRNL